MIVRPKSTPENHWISIELQGTQSNRLALNARVRVRAGDLVQTQEVTSGGSYLSQDDLRLHFGLAEHTRADKVELLWPGGKTEVLDHLPADRFYNVKEGSGIVSSHAAEPSQHKHR